jgi:hypothetical protein
MKKVIISLALVVMFSIVTVHGMTAESTSTPYHMSNYFILSSQRRLATLQLLEQTQRTAVTQDSLAEV